MNLRFSVRVLGGAASLLLAGVVAGCGSDDSPAPPDQLADAAADGNADAKEAASPDADSGSAGSGNDAGPEAEAEAGEDAQGDAPADAVKEDAPEDSPATDAATDALDEGNGADAPGDAAPEETGTDASADSADADAAQDASSEAADGSADASGQCQVPGPSKDVWRPTVAIKQAAGQKDPTSTLPLIFTVTFSEPMNAASLSAGDFVAAPELGTELQLVDSGDHMNFELRITDVSREGNFGVTLPAGRATDLAGNPNEASTGTDKVFYDSTLPRVEIRPTVPTIAINTLPYSYSITFLPAIDPATFDVSDIVNLGTATGVTWQLQAQSPGYLYSLSATAVANPGTLQPVVPGGAVTDTQAAPNMMSKYLGDPVVYTTLPILSIADTKANEGDNLTFMVKVQGTIPQGVSFDWTTADGTALAGADYVQKGQVNVAYPTNVYYVPLQVSAAPDDVLPEPHKEFSVKLSNIKGGVYVARDHAVGTVANDDRGWSSFAMNEGYYAEATADEIVIHGNTVHIYGTSSKFGAVIERRNATTDETEQYLTVGTKAAGIGQNESGYYFAIDDGQDGFRLMKYSHATQTADSAFGYQGEIQQIDAQNGYVSKDVVADESAVYVMGSRGAAPVWYVERRDASTGALMPGFGTAGVLQVDHAAMAELEAVTRGASDGTSLLLLGQVGSQWMVEKRAAADGALDAMFGSGGVMGLDCLTRAGDLAIYDGALYVVGDGDAGAVLSRFELATGSKVWERWSAMTSAGALAVGDSGVYAGGVRGGAWQVERWQHDGTPAWAQTYLRDKAPAGARALALHGTEWLYAAGYHSWNGDRDWYYERRFIGDGLTYLYEPGNPPQ